jgi:hypothetical protein
MKHTPVTSRAIREVGYDLPTHIMEMMFSSVSLYRYFDVPEFLYRGFRRQETLEGVQVDGSGA